MNINNQTLIKQQVCNRLPLSPFPRAKPLPPSSLVCDMRIPLPDMFLRQTSKSLTPPALQVRLHGNSTQPIVVVLGGISANRIVASSKNQRGWWSKIVGKGRAIDTNEFCILSIDFLPNDLEQEQEISTKEQAQALAHVLEVLNIRSIHALVGTSYGGMVALCFASLFADKLQRLIILCAAHHPNPSATALRGIQRRIIRFGLQNGDGEGAVALARQLAMTTYRTAEEFSQRFNTGGFGHENSSVCEYLIAQGSAFKMSPQRYLTLSHSLDLHKVDPARIQTPTKLIAIDSDQVVPIEDMRELAADLPVSQLIEISSIYGHDGFLKEAPTIGPHLNSFLIGTSS